MHVVQNAGSRRQHKNVSVGDAAGRKPAESVVNVPVYGGLVQRADAVRIRTKGCRHADEQQNARRNVTKGGAVGAKPNRTKEARSRKEETPCGGG